MFTRLHVHNFRAVGPAPVELELRPLTVLVGENGCGKSSILEALALTAQSAVEDRNRTDLVLSGSRFECNRDTDTGNDPAGPCRSVYFKKDARLPLSVDFNVSVDERAMRTAAWETSEAPTCLRGLVTSWPPRELSYRWSRKHVSGHDAWSHEVRVDKTVVVSSTMDWGEPWRGVSTAEGSLTIGQQALRTWVWGSRVLTSDLFQEDRFKREAGVDGSLPREIERIGDTLKEVLDGVLVLSPLRGYGLMHTDVGPDVEFVGLHGENTIRMLSNVQQKSRPEFQRFEAWAGRFGLPRALPGWAGGNRLRVAFVDPVTGASMDLADAASGSKQGLVLAAQLLLTKPGSTLLLEEPENNLHPRFEKLLPELFAESIASGHQILASTHSEVLVAALGNAVRRGLLRPDQVAIWHLTRDAEGIHPHEVRVSDKGYLDGWIESFSKVEQELFDEWAQGLPEVGDETGRGHARAGKGSGRPRRKRGE